MGAGFLKMGGYDIDELHFLTYVPNGIQIEIFKYRPDFFQEMKKEMIKYYIDFYLPRWWMKTNDLLKKGEINIISEIEYQEKLDKKSIRSFSKPRLNSKMDVHSFGDFGSDFIIKNF